MKICRHRNAREFLDRAEDWLLQREAEHNVLLGVAHQLLAGGHGFEEPIYFATVEADGDVAGCAFRTPPFKLGLTRLPLSAIPSLVQDVNEVYASLPAIFGPDEQATRFADLWTQRLGGRTSMGMRQRIHALEAVAYLPGNTPGSLRRAEPRDRSLALRWLKASVRDMGTTEADPHGRVEQLIHDGTLYLWEDDEPRSMAAAVAETPNGVRVGHVYTPPQSRGRGYATATVAMLSQSLLRTGRHFCFLYTDLANSTSNAIYERIGYRRTCDVIDVHLVRSDDEYVD